MAREASRPMKMQFETDIPILSLETTRERNEQAAKAEWEKAVCEKIAVVLMKNFPGYTWHVRCDLWYERENKISGMNERVPGGVQIQIPAIMPPTKLYNIPIAMLNTENDFERLARRAGGELLERFNQPREGINFDCFEAARPRIMLDHKSEVPS